MTIGYYTLAQSWPRCRPVRLIRRTTLLLIVYCVDADLPPSGVHQSNVTDYAELHRSRSRGSTDKPGSATSTATPATDTHSYRTIFTENSQLGFTTHTFDDTFDTLSHRYISAKGQVLHSFETIRGFARREYHRRAALKK